LLPKFLHKLVCHKQPKTVQPAQPTSQSCQKNELQKNIRYHMTNNKLFRVWEGPYEDGTLQNDGYIGFVFLVLSWSEKNWHVPFTFRQGKRIGRTMGVGSNFDLPNAFLKTLKNLVHIFHSGSCVTSSNGQKVDTVKIAQSLFCKNYTLPISLRCFNDTFLMKNMWAFVWQNMGVKKYASVWPNRLNYLSLIAVFNQMRSIHNSYLEYNYKYRIKLIVLISQLFLQIFTLFLLANMHLDIVCNCGE